MICSIEMKTLCHIYSTDWVGHVKNESKLMEKANMEWIAVSMRRR